MNPTFQAGLRLAPLLAMLALQAGCANSPKLDQRFGMAVHSNTMLQVLDPGAPRAAGAAGMDGKAAKAAYDNYQKSYQEPVSQSGALTIGVGR
jgi:outer membrane murein-binding lipoprotein Lpp